MNFGKNLNFCHFFALPFITKAEFDSLKNNFQSQIDQYNSSIDSKIDGAIAAYLAGIKLETVSTLTSLINKISDLKFVQSLTNVGLEAKKNGMAQGGWVVQYSRGNLGRGATRPAIQVAVGYPKSTTLNLQTNGTEQEQLLVCKTGSKDKTKWEPQYYMKSTPFGTFSAMDNYAYGGAASYSGYPSTKLNAVTIDFKGTNFGSETYGYVWQLNGSSATTSGINTQQPIDVSTADLDFSKLSGSTVTGQCYMIKSDELNLKGDVSDKKLTGGVSDSYGSANGTGANDIEIGNDGRGSGGLAWQKSVFNIYRHKTYDTNLTDLENTTLSNIYDKSVGWYNGAPLFYATDNGKVKLKLKVTGTNGATATIAINDTLFANENITIGLNTGKQSTCDRTSTADWTWTVGETYETNFEVEKGKTYWIKAYPDANTSYVGFTSEEIRLTIES